MSYMVDGYYGDTAATAPVNERVAFVRRTYAHLAGAIAALVAIDGFLLQSGVGKEVLQSMFASRGAWLVLMVLFVGGGYVAQMMAQSARSIGTQYAGLSLYVMIEALILLPILYRADTQFQGQHLTLKAAALTLLVFGGLTATVFVSGKDFSFMGSFLRMCGFLALGLVAFAVLGPVLGIGGLNLGVWFSVLMIGLAAGFIIYDTSNVIHQYGTNQHVAASLALFASVATLFYYILRLFMATRND